MDTVTEQDLLEAIRRAYSFDVNVHAMTANEIADATNTGIGTVRRKLKNLVAEDRIQVTWVYRETLVTPLTGRMARVPGYVIRQSVTPDLPDEQ